VARLGHPGKGGGRVKTVVAYIDGRKRLDGVITLDNTTLGEYVAEDSSSDRIDAVIAALSGTVSVKVYDGSGVEKASGTMGSPWATNVSGQLVVGALSSFSVTGAGTPDAGWYLRFESGARWVRGSFGLKGSGQEFTWSQSTWAVGHTGRIGNVVMLAPTNAAPSWSGAPSTLSLYAGQTYNFAQHASDPNGDPLTFSKASGVGAVSSDGGYTVGDEGAAVIRASDGVLSADHAFSVSYPVESARMALNTNFGEGVWLQAVNTWSTGGFYRLGGVDASTGFDFSDPYTAPLVYGRGTGNALADGRTVFQIIQPSGYTVPTGGVGARDLSNGYWAFRLESVTGPAGTGITTACYQERKQPYGSSAQIPFIMHPNLAQSATGLYYVRFWRRYKTGYFAACTAGGTNFNALIGSKTTERAGGGAAADRPIYGYVNNNRSGYVSADSERGSFSGSDTYRGSTFANYARHRVDGSNTTQPLPTINENEWIRYEFAFRPSNSDSVGFQWAAVNGTQAFAAQGKTIPDIRTAEVERLFLWNFYFNGNQANNTALGYWTTGVQVFEGWPSDASSHPNWT
jgi:hypothetical protein